MQKDAPCDQNTEHVVDSTEDDDEGEAQCPRERRMARSKSPHADWPLSQDEKKDMVIQMYEQESRATSQLLQDASTDGMPSPGGAPRDDVAALREEVESLKAFVRRLTSSLVLPEGASATTCEEDVPRRPVRRNSLESDGMAGSQCHASSASSSRTPGYDLLFAAQCTDDEELSPRSKSEGVLWRSENRPMVTRRRRRSRPDAPLRVTFSDGKSAGCSSDSDGKPAKHPPPVAAAQPEVFMLDQRRKDKGCPLERSTSAEAIETDLRSQHHIMAAERGPQRASVRSSVRRGRALRRRHEYLVQLMPRSADQDGEYGDDDDVYHGKSLAPSLSTANLAQAWAWTGLQQASLPNGTDEPHPEPGTPRESAIIWPWARSLFGES